jgi:hypothetical protein
MLQCIPLDKARTDTALSEVNDPSDAGKLFDQRFSELYLGQPLSSNTSAFQAWVNNGLKNRVVLRTGFLTGSSGFGSTFLDSDDPKADQTHHFAAYFAAGYHRLDIVTSAHRARDNLGDDRLGGAAFRMSGLLQTSPRVMLPQVGKVIIDTVCNN